jgi:hypothetical protein
MAGLYVAASIFLSSISFAINSTSPSIDYLISQAAIRSLVPIILFKEQWYSSQNERVEEIKGVALTNTNHPIAVLNKFNDKSYKLNEFFSLKLPKINGDLESSAKKGDVSYTVISSIRYVINEKNVFLTTCWMSPRARELKYYMNSGIITDDGSTSTGSIKFNNGVKGLVFFNPRNRNLRNQIVFLYNKYYYVSIGSQMSLAELQHLVNKHFSFGYLSN